MPKKVKHKHMNQYDRFHLFAYYTKGMSIPLISSELNISRSTVYRELRRLRSAMDGLPAGKHAEKTPCELLGKYLLCNRCPKLDECRNRFHRCYDPVQAHQDYRRKKEGCRSGMISVDDRTMKAIDTIVSEGVLVRGVSLEYLYRTEEVLRKVSLSTIRRWLNEGRFRAKRINLRRAKRMRKSYAYQREKGARTALSVDKAMRTMDLFRDYTNANGDCIRIQLDSVEGRQRDKRHIFTLMIVDMNFQVGFIYDKKDGAETVLGKVTDILSELRKHTEKPFAVLSDNGPEFDSLFRAEGNVSGTHVFYADPYRSNDKAECERRHELLRYFTPKGRSVDGLSQETLDEWFSNINSYQTEKTKWSKPAMLVAEAYSIRFLDYLHIRIVKDDKVRLKP